MAVDEEYTYLWWIFEDMNMISLVPHVFFLLVGDNNNDMVSYQIEPTSKNTWK